MYNKIVNLSLLLCSFNLIAAPDAIGIQVNFHGSIYKLSFDHNNLIAQKGKQQVKGNLVERHAMFSQWDFPLNNTTGFSLIINEKNRTILNQKNNLDAGGPFLISTSPDEKLVVFDYGTSPGPRKFEVLTDDGKVIFKDTYLNKLQWDKLTLKYDLPESVPISLNAKTKSCEAVGSAWKVQEYYFNGKTKEKVDKPSTFECSN